MSGENIENMTKTVTNFAPTFAAHHVLPDMNSNGHCLINNMYIPKKVRYIYIRIYFLHTKSMFKKFK